MPDLDRVEMVRLFIEWSFIGVLCLHHYHPDIFCQGCLNAGSCHRLFQLALTWLLPLALLENDWYYVECCMRQYNMLFLVVPYMLKYV